MNGKRWSILLIGIYAAAMALIGGLVLVVDPYFHYHAPIKGLSYSLENNFYINDGVSKRFPYSAMITGTSLTRSFRTEEADALFDRQFVRITYHGEGFKRINNNLEAALTANPDLKLVIRGVDTMWFIADENWEGYDEYPEYLSDDIWWNDVYYLYNKEILWKAVASELARTVKGEPADSFDEYTAGDTSPGREAVIEGYDRPQFEDRTLDPEETKEYFAMLERNLDVNVLSVVEENPDVTFYLFFPPYSICWWDSLHQGGEASLMRRIDMEQFAIERLLACGNVRLFSFFNNYDLVCDLDNYVDDVHYSDKVSSQLLVWMKEGKYELTKDNYMDYIGEIRNFYGQFDYDAFFKK